MIEKLKSFFEKYSGVGGPASFTQTDTDDKKGKTITCDFGLAAPSLMVAEERAPSGTKKSPEV